MYFVLSLNVSGSDKQRQQCLKSLVFESTDLAHVIYFNGALCSPKTSKQIGTLYK